MQTRNTQSDAAPCQDDPWTSWLRTGTLVLVGATLVGIIAGRLVPRPPPPIAANSTETPGKAEISPARNEAALPVPPAEPPLPPQAPQEPAPKSEGPAEPPPPKPPPKPEPRPEPKPELKPEPKPELKPEPKPELKPEPKPELKPEPEPELKPEPKLKPAPTEKPRPPEDPAKRAAFDRAVFAARRAMSGRDLAAARGQIQAAAGNLQNPADDAQFERLKLMLGNLEQFWQGIRIAVAKLRPTETIVLPDDNRAAVVSASQTHLTVHVYGRNQEYRIEALPTELVFALVQQAFAPTPGSKMVVGTFFLVDPQGDPARARRLWDDVSRTDAEMGRFLLPELPFFAPVGKAEKATKKPSRGKR